MSEYEMAVKGYTEALNCLPTDDNESQFNVRMARCEAYCDSMKFEDALMDAKAAIDFMPEWKDEADGHINMIKGKLLYIEKNNLGDAAPARDPSFIDYYKSAAEIWEKILKGENREEGLRRRDLFTQAKVSLGECYQRIGRWDLAAKYFAEAMETVKTPLERETLAIQIKTCHVELENAKKFLEAATGRE